MSLLGRDVVEVDALVTDRYLDSLLTAGDASAAWQESAAGDALPVPPGGPVPGSRGRVWFLGGRQREIDPERLDRGVRLASERLMRDLPRFHPSFRFEERLAVRLAEAAAAMRLPVAAGGGAAPRFVPFPAPNAPGADPLARAADPRGEDGEGHPFGPGLSGAGLSGPGLAGQVPRPLLVSGVVAASALSLAGAAWVAWRRSRPNGSPMARAARAAHAMRGRSTPPMRGRMV